MREIEVKCLSLKFILTQTLAKTKSFSFGIHEDCKFELYMSCEDHTHVQNFKLSTWNERDWGLTFEFGIYSDTKYGEDKNLWFGFHEDFGCYTESSNFTGVVKTIRMYRALISQLVVDYNIGV